MSFKCGRSVEDDKIKKTIKMRQLNILMTDS